MDMNNFCSPSYHFEVEEFRDTVFSNKSNKFCLLPATNRPFSTLAAFFLYAAKSFQYFLAHDNDMFISTSL